MEPAHELNASDTRPLLRSWRRRITSVFAFVGAAGFVLAIASPAVVHYRTLHFDRATREIRVKTRDWVRNRGYDAPAVVEDTVDTSLLRLRRRSIEIRRFEPSVIADSEVYWPGAGSAMTSRDSRVLIANRHGSFFEIDLSAAEKIRRIPLRLETNYEALSELLNAELKEQASLEGSHGLRYVGVTDLLFLTDRPSLAAAYTYWNAQQKCLTSRVALVDVAQGWPSGTGGWRVVFESTPCLTLTRHHARGNQAGGRLAEVGPGKLYVAVGDFGHDGVVNKDVVSQDSTVSYGKILEVDVDTLDHRIVATGIRNPEGLTRDGQGRMWSTDHGPNGGDELNLIRTGKNYGWPYATYGTNYGSHVWPLSNQQGRHDGYEEPVFAWTPSIDVSDLIAVRNFSPEWNGDLLVLSLVGRRLSRIRLSGERVVFEEPIPTGERLRDVTQLADGRIVLWTDTANLVVLSVDTRGSTR